MERGRGVGRVAAIVAAAALGALPGGVAAQLGWDADAWTVRAAEHRVESHLGREGLYLERGTAWMDGVEFQDGVVEFDLAATAAQGFHGIRFRAETPGDHEHLYLRPHLSGMPDATQYNPIYNGVSSWQLYHGPPYTLPVEVPADRWIRVRVAILGERMEMTVDGGEPLVYSELVRAPRAGSFGINSSGAGAWFANVAVRPGREAAAAVMGASAVSTAEASGEGGAEAAPPAVARWRVSAPFPEARVAGRASLAPGDLPGGWRTVETDVRGMVNLARHAALGDGANTVFAALTLRADEARTVPAELAFSDRARVFLNGRQLWAGADGWRSRDYRFLGTAGFFDTVFLPLEEGENELLVAVSEDFGGWGVGARLPEGVAASP